MYYNLKNDWLYVHLERGFKTKYNIVDGINLITQKLDMKLFLVNKITQIKKLLDNNYYCLITFPVYNLISLWNKQNDSEEIIGGCIFLLCGYDSCGFHLHSNCKANEYMYYKYSDWGSHWEILHIKLKNVESKVDVKCCTIQ